jgi:DNA-binding response OmpR family regulator
MTKILIVEDDATLAETLVDNLEEEGYEVFRAADGENALAMIRAKLPDLIVLDIMLPILDGLSVCRIIRKDPSTLHIPIIMLTARGTEVDKIVGLESGADDYIVKPFGLGEFLARVRAVMRRMPGRPALQDELISNDLRIDLILTKVWGYEYFGDKRTVDVHVRWLREKIEEDASNPTRIVTVRGVGYRFEG